METRSQTKIYLLGSTVTDLAGDKLPSCLPIIHWQLTLKTVISRICSLAKTNHQFEHININRLQISCTSTYCCRF